MGMRMCTGLKWPAKCSEIDIFMIILAIKVPENLLTNPTSTSRKAFFPEVLRLLN